MAGLLPSAIFLGLAALGALFLTLRRSTTDGVAERLAASRVLAVALGIQTMHFVEEAVTGFPDRFGPLLGFAAMSYGFFVVFNAFWIAVWGASVRAVRQARPWAVFAAWFLAIAGTLNGIAHPALALLAGGYFPGLVTSPFVGAASVWLGVRLHRMTGPARPPTRR